MWSELLWPFRTEKDFHGIYYKPVKYSEILLLKGPNLGVKC